MEYIVKVIAVSGKGNKVYNSGTPVTSDMFPEGHAEKLAKKGYLEPTKDAKKELAKRAEKEKKDAAALVAKYEAQLEEKKAKFDKTKAPNKKLKTYQDAINAAQKKVKTSNEALKVAADDVKKFETALDKAKDEGKEKAEKDLADAKEMFETSKTLSEKNAAAAETAVTELKEAQDDFKKYSDLQREVKNAEALVINAKKQLEKL